MEGVEWRIELNSNSLALTQQLREMINGLATSIRSAFGGSFLRLYIRVVVS